MDFPSLDRQVYAELRRVYPGEQLVEPGPAFDRLAGASIPFPVTPLAYVYPTSAEQITQTLTLARRFKVHVWPVSRGRNWGYGSQSVLSGHTILISLERMNKIHSVDTELAYAVIEPGVTYRQLREYLDKHHPELWCDCTDGPPLGSVIGNALDRGLGVTPYGDHFATLCGMEVILANGETIRTGGGGDDCHTFFTHKWGVGPYVEGLFTQSNLGIVVKAGVWLVPKPEKFVSFVFDMPDDKNLPQVIDVIRKLTLDRTLQSYTHIINDIVTLAVRSQAPKHSWGKNVLLDKETLAKMKKKHRVPDWSFGGGIMGTKGQVDDCMRILKRDLAGFGHMIFLRDGQVSMLQNFLQWLRLTKRRRLSALLQACLTTVSRCPIEMIEEAPRIHSLLKGIPSDYFVRHAYWRGPIDKPQIAHIERDHVGLVWFAPIVPMTGVHVQKMMDICRPLYDDAGFDFYVALLIQNPRSMVVLQALYYDKTNSAQEKKVAELYQELTRVTEEHGYQQYRVGVNGMDDLFKNQSGYREMLHSIKRAMDPDHVFADGKYGVR